MDAITEDYEIEVEANLRELNGLVQTIKLLPRQVGSGMCTYEVNLLEGKEPLRVDFIRGRGYFVGNNQHFETFQALLSRLSPKYREAFGRRISEELQSLLKN